MQAIEQSLAGFFDGDLRHIAVPIFKRRRARCQIKIPHSAETIIKAHFFNLIPAIIKCIMPHPQGLRIAFAEFNGFFHLKASFDHLLS